MDSKRTRAGNGWPAQQPRGIRQPISHMRSKSMTVTTRSQEIANRMPVFPFLLSLIYRPGMSEKQFLNRAQVFNVNLSIVLLLLLWLILRKSLPDPPSVGAADHHCVWRIPVSGRDGAGRGAFLFRKLRRISPPPANADRAPLVARAPERSNDGDRAFDQGIDFARARSRAAVFLVQIFSSDRARRSDESGSTWRRLGMLLLVIGAFAAVIFPYIRTSKNVYGSYFTT